MRPALLLLLLALAALAAFFLARQAGSAGFAWSVDPALAGWRLSRAWTAFIVGGLLALAGTLMQLLLRNPLAEPFVLGVSGGASAGVLAALLLGIAAWGRELTAFAGALVAIALVFAANRRRLEPTRLLLSGVVLAAGWGALLSLGLALVPDRQLPGLVFWLLGEIRDDADNVLGLSVLIAGLGLSLAGHRALDLLRLGDTQAALLGLPLKRVRLFLYFLAAGLAATAVSLAGSIGFIGLVVPHGLRLLGLTEHRQLLPGAVLAGGALLVLAECGSRSLAAPLQLPVGALTALLGVPAFLWLMRRSLP
ncbi:MAG: iron ABC transporter permease [Gammaproteobacteria bacterium]|nr:iron ABC transporter permease [Gammaproteobacteria bacterium]